MKLRRHTKALLIEKSQHDTVVAINTVITDFHDRAPAHEKPVIDRLMGELLELYGANA